MSPATDPTPVPAPDDKAPLQLLWRDGVPLSAPLPVTHDQQGAALLAELYASAPDRVHVRAMMNTTVDGAVAGADGTSGSLRNPDDSFVFGVLRALTDVVVVGSQTVRAEDYRRPLGRRDLLDPSRRPAGGSRPALAIWTSTGELPSSIEAEWPTYLLSPAEHAARVQERSGMPAEHVIAAGSAREAVEFLVARGYRGIQAEGGPSTLGRLAEEGLLDELCVSVSHRTVGGPSPRMIDGQAHDQRWELSSLLVGRHATITRYRRPL